MLYRGVQPGANVCTSLDPDWKLSTVQPTLPIPLPRFKQILPVQPIYYADVTRVAWQQYIERQRGLQHPLDEIKPS